jgi:hypothetical protein
MRVRGVLVNTEGLLIFVDEDVLLTHDSSLFFEEVLEHVEDVLDSLHIAYI